LAAWAVDYRRVAVNRVAETASSRRTPSASRWCGP